MSATTIIKPIVSKLYCSASQVVVLTVRKRPHVVSGGGLVVMDDCSQKIIFRVDGCGTLGIKGELVLRDADGESLLLIRRKGGMFQALSIHSGQWKGYMVDYEGAEKLVFSLKEPNSCLAKNIKVNVGPKKCNLNKDWDFEVRGSFPDKACSIIDCAGNTVAQIGVRKGQLMMVSKDLYQVQVQPGYDQAFVFGVIAVLDHIYGESTHC
ncbi:protein LURP-one-related 6-like [Macadamia integrifolia]|uniref:protein LURP-one-related 6-like n=1 Tax=Macadamia integrifolia TaxID=60698 RepID=UPI001C4ECA8F|nr:protein LURP-one-related 6-like [Macadamia integrifolia]